MCLFFLKWWSSYSTILFFLLLFSSCSQKEENVINKTGELVINTKFAVSSRFSGTHYDAKSNTEYFYLSNGRTNKKVSFFTLDGKLVKSIDFKNATQGHRLEDIDIHSLDTILAISQRSGVLFYINSDGICFRKLNLNHLIPDSVPQTSLMSSASGGFLHKQDLYLGRGLKLPRKNNTPYYEYLQNYFNTLRQLPYFVKVKNVFSDNPSVHFFADSLYSKIIPKNCTNSDIPTYSFLNNQIIVSSYEIDSLFIFDLNGKYIKSVFTEYSGKIDQNLKNEQITEDHFLKPSNHSKWSTINANIISRVHYNKSNDKYYVVALHSFDGDDNQSFNNRNWSLITYDSNFKKEKETVIKNQKNRPSFSLLTSKGLFSKMNSNLISNYDPHKTYFNIYNIE